MCTQNSARQQQRPGTIASLSCEPRAGPSLAVDSRGPALSCAVRLMMTPPAMLARPELCPDPSVETLAPDISDLERGPVTSGPHPPFWHTALKRELCKYRRTGHTARGANCALGIFSPTSPHVRASITSHWWPMSQESMPVSRSPHEIPGGQASEASGWSTREPVSSGL